MEEIQSGDYIKVIKSNSYVSRDRVCKVVCRNGDSFKVTINEREYWLHRDWIELCENDVKVGDRVRITHFPPGVPQAKVVGHTGTITGIAGINSYNISLPGFPTFAYPREYFELLKDISEETHTSETSLKIGDTVKIKSIDWYNANKDRFGNMKCGGVIFISEMSELCGKLFTIRNIIADRYYLKKVNWTFSKEMFELPSDCTESGSQKAKISLIESSPILELDNEPILTGDITLLKDDQILINLSTI